MLSYSSRALLFGRVPNIDTQLATSTETESKFGTATLQSATAAALTANTTLPPMVPYSQEAAHLWMKTYHAAIGIEAIHSTPNLLINSVCGQQSSWLYKRRAAAAWARGDMIQTLDALARYQLLREDLTSLAPLRRLHSSITGVTLRVIHEVCEFV
jgi:hypothetical protein